MLNSTDKIIKHKTGLLHPAEELGNVSKLLDALSDLESAITQVQ